MISQQILNKPPIPRPSLIYNRLLGHHGVPPHVEITAVFFFIRIYQHDALFSSPMITWLCHHLSWLCHATWKKELISITRFHSNFNSIRSFFLIQATKIAASKFCKFHDNSCATNCSDRLIRILIRAKHNFIWVTTTGKNTISEIVPASLPIGLPRDPIWSIWYSGIGWMRNIQSCIFLNHVSVLRHR